MENNNQLQIVSNKSLQINTTIKEKQLTISQKNILKLINNCIEENKVLSMIDIIKCYQKSVKENHSIYKDTWYDKNGNKLKKC